MSVGLSVNSGPPKKLSTNLELICATIPKSGRFNWKAYFFWWISDEFDDDFSFSRSSGILEVGINLEFLNF